MIKYSDIYIQCPEMKSYTIIDTKAKLKKLAHKMSTLEEFAFDTETNTLRVYGPNKDFKCVGISISWGAYHNYYIPLGHIREEDFDRQLPLRLVVKWLKPVFEREEVRIIGHSLKFDLHVMARIGIFIKTKDLFDTMIASWLCDENTPNNLKDNSMQKLGISQTHFAEVTATVSKEIKKQFGLKGNQKATFDMVLIDDGAPYALADSFNTWTLYLGALVELEEEGMLKIYNKTYRKFLRTLFEMEERGVQVNYERLAEMEKEVAKDIDDLLYQLYEIAGIEFNVKSNEQLGALLCGYQKPEPLHPSEDDPDKKANKEWRQAKKDGNKKVLARLEREYEKKLAEHSGKYDTLMKYSFKMKSPTKTASGAPQLNALNLTKMSRVEYKSKRKREGAEFCSKLLEFKKLEKLSSAFIGGLGAQLYDDNKAHPSFNIIGTDSGRLSCSSPNLQQLPKAEEEDKYQIRSLFIGSEYVADKDGKWVSDDLDVIDDDPTYLIKRKKIIAGDYNNLEMRVLAHYSKDPNLMEMFLTGSDTHSSTAVNMFELDCDISEVKKKYPHLRQAAKTINFLLMYGGGASTLYNKLKEDTWSPIDLGDDEYLEQYHAKDGLGVAQIYIDKYFDTYSGVTTFMTKQKRFAHKNGYIMTLLRRKRRLPDINSHNFKAKSYCERLSVNACIQGSAADITMSGQNRIKADDWFRENGVNMLIQVHDELVFETPDYLVEESIERAKRYMEHPFGDNVELNLPMLTSWDSGDSYQDAK